MLLADKVVGADNALLEDAEKVLNVIGRKTVFRDVFACVVAHASMAVKLFADGAVQTALVRYEDRCAINVRAEKGRHLGCGRILTRECADAASVWLNQRNDLCLVPEALA